MASQLTVKDLKDIVRRRKKACIALPLVIFLASVVIALALPDIYKSQTTIMIEGQEIPENYIKSTVTSYLEERLNIMTYRIMSYPKLAEIVHKFDPYPELREVGEDTTGRMVGELKKNIEFETVSTDTGTLNKKVTTAFMLSFSGKDPQVVQNITQELASLYVAEDIKTKEKHSETTTEFLEAELQNYKDQLAVHEARISEFKKEHVGELPEYERVTFQEIERAERELEQIAIRQREAQKQRNFLLGQIASVEPLTPIQTSDGKVMQNPETRLKSLRLELINLRSSLSEKHPDIIKLKNMIAELEAQVGDVGDDTSSVKRLRDSQTKLATLSGKLGPKHPDVIKMKNEVDLLSEQVQSMKRRRSVNNYAAQRPDNPTYINLMTQIENANSEIRALNEQELRTQMRLQENKLKAAKIPIVEKEYNDLTLGYENAKAKYNELLNKLSEAKLSQQMDVSQQGERFTIAEPAFLPGVPYKPNRLMIMLLGIFLGVGAGLTVAAFQEQMDTSVKTADELVELSGIPVIANLSFIQTREEERRRKLRKIGWSIVAVLCLVIAIVVVDQFVMTIDSLWAKVQERLTTMRLPL
jgi:uncharacterized protein involved in exopolysaccharide biosynthesis